MMTEVTWPYSTFDEISHLVCEDVAELRARIDQLLEERRSAVVSQADDDFTIPVDWYFTPAEERVLKELLRAPRNKVVTKPQLHAAHANCAEPETEEEVVNVVICRLRARLGPGMIMTVWGRGYFASEDLRSRVRS